MKISSLRKKLQDVRSRYGLSTLAATAVLVVSGIGLLSYGLSDNTNQPKFTPLEASAVSSVTPTDAPVLGYAEPTSISIPSIDVSSDVIHLGKNKDNTLAVPAGPDVTKVAWYKHSPSPGQIGASVFSGHLDQVGGTPNVFFRLGELQIGDSITIQRSDKSSVEFIVTDKQKYLKDDFPTDKVYGATDIPTIRLITCGGAFLPTENDYDSNIVVYAEIKSATTPNIANKK